MPVHTEYDINKAPNVAPRINRKCGAAIVRALLVYFDDPDSPAVPDLSAEEEKDVTAFLNNLRGNVNYWRDKQNQPRV